MDCSRNFKLNYSDLNEALPGGILSKDQIKMIYNTPPGGNLVKHYPIQRIAWRNIIKHYVTPPGGLLLKFKQPQETCKYLLFRLPNIIMHVSEYESRFAIHQGKLSFVLYIWFDEIHHISSLSLSNSKINLK